MLRVKEAPGKGALLRERHAEMAKKTYITEQIINKLSKAKVLISQG
jgi:hypothetical protein